MRVPAPLARAVLPAPVLAVLRRLAGAGHRSFIVGGAVRDLLLRRAHDADFDVATPARPEQVIALFRRVVPTGIAHGTVTVISSGHPVEVTTFRGEGAYEDGRRPSSVTFHDDLEADLARRDFTINAIAWDPLAPELRDPFRGRADLAARLVRAVGEPSERFGEDGLRALRAVRFAAVLDFRLDDRTRRAIPASLEVVAKVSRERVTDELVKLACAARPDRGLALLARTGLLAVLAPDLAELPGEALAHAGRVARAAPAEPAVRLAALLHVLPADRVEPVLASLRIARRASDEADALVDAHACRSRRGAALPAGGEAVRRWLAGVGPERAAAALSLARAEAEAAPASRRPAIRREVRALGAAVDAEMRAGAPLAAKDLALDGRGVMDLLGAGPGPHVGEALRHLLDQVLARPGDNRAHALEAMLRRWWASRPAKL